MPEFSSEYSSGRELRASFLSEMAKTRSYGIPGSAVLLGTAGLYLAYVGVKNVPFFEGLREVLRRERPTPKAFTAVVRPTADPGTSKAFAGGTLGLQGSALAALPKLQAAFPGLVMLGKGDRPGNPSSDHPLGKAIDVMTTDEQTAQRIISLFRTLSGAKYWIWNRRIAQFTLLWIPRSYTGPSPHTDHVHLSFF